MRQNKIKALMIALVLAGVGAAAGVVRADTLNWSFSFDGTSDGNTVQGSGTLTGHDMLATDGSGYEEYLVTDGEIDSLHDGYVVDQNNPPFTLDAGSVGALVYSPSGFFIFDNLVFPSSPSIVDNGGLLFTRGSDEVNIFSSGNETVAQPVTFYENTGFNELVTLDMNITPHFDVAVAQSTPLPAAAVSGVFLIGLLAFSRRKSLIA